MGGDIDLLSQNEHTLNKVRLTGYQLPNREKWPMITVHPHKANRIQEEGSEWTNPIE